MAPWLAIQVIKITFSANLIKLIRSFLTHMKFRVSVEGELSTPREITVVVPQCFVLAPTLYNLYIYDASKSQGST
jgi:hypothetical protein